jgi:GNAT superfamily N-acetyltransferase
MARGNARSQGVALRFASLTPTHWSAFESLFADSAVCSRCWCMGWRIERYRARAAGRNQADFRDIVERGPPPGFLAFDGDLAVGWCQLTPRDDVPVLDRNWRLRRVDATPVLCISCFYVRKAYRRRGVSAALLSQAMRVAERLGAPALEAYPLDRSQTPSATSTGVLTTFVRAGFEEVARRVPARPIVRHDLRELPEATRRKKNRGSSVQSPARRSTMRRKQRI